MEIGIAGLDGPGGGVARRLTRAGDRVVVFHPDADAAFRLAQELGLAVCTRLTELASGLGSPRILWVAMAPERAGEVLHELRSVLSGGDLVVNASAGHFQEAPAGGGVCRARDGLRDAGISGGEWGAEFGYGVMLGGGAEWIGRLKPLMDRLAAGGGKGWLHCGPSGSGHFVKMAQDRIEQNMLGTFAHGFAFLQGRQYIDIKPQDVVQMWQAGGAKNEELRLLADEFLTANGIAPEEDARPLAAQGLPPGTAPAVGFALMLRTATQGMSTYMEQLLAAATTPVPGASGPGSKTG